MTLRSLLSAGILITVGMLASRLLGFLREALIAAQYGVGADASMAIGLLMIPDYITATLIGGALSAALIPAFSAREPEERLALFWQSLGLSVVLFAILALLVFSQSHHIIASLHGSADNVPAQALLWALCSMPLAGAGGVITAWLQYHHRFAAPAFANALFNLGIVLALWLAPSGFTVLGLAILLAAAARLALQFTGFLKSTDNVVSKGQKWQINRRLFGHYASAVGNSFFSLLPQYAPYVVITLMAGQMALFNYAFKLILLPGMLINTVIGMVLLPRFVHLRKAGKDVQEYGYAIRMSFTLALCIVLAASAVSTYIVVLCFGHGAMTPDDVIQVSIVFATGLWALPGMIVGYLLQQIFYACERPGIPFKVGVTQAILCIPLTWFLQKQSLESGSMMAYVLVQTLPIILFCIAAQKHRIIPLRAQWQGVGAMVLAPIMVFIPFAWVFYTIPFNAFVGLALALVCGAFMLGAALMTDTQTCQWVKDRIKRT